jgi:DNA topoisomerase-1
MRAGDPLERRRIAATQHFTEPPPRFTEASLVKRMEELGIGRPSTYAAVLQVLRDREYVRIEKKRLVPEDKGRIVTAFLESFFRRYVEYDFTADLEEQLDRVSNHEVDWKEILRDFWRDFSAAIGGTKELRTTEILEALNELLGPYIFPPKPDLSAVRASSRSSSAATARSSAARTTRSASTPASLRPRAPTAPAKDRARTAWRRAASRRWAMIPRPACR